MISVNKSTGAFIRQFREVAPCVQLFNISVVNPKEPARLAGEDTARGIGNAQVAIIGKSGMFYGDGKLSRLPNLNRQSINRGA